MSGVYSGIRTYYNRRRQLFKLGWQSPLISGPRICNNGSLLYLLLLLLLLIPHLLLVYPRQSGFIDGTFERI
jgi:hypothetical protein